MIPLLLASLASGGELDATAEVFGWATSHDGEHPELGAGGLGLRGGLPVGGPVDLEVELSGGLGAEGPRLDAALAARVWLTERRGLSLWLGAGAAPLGPRVEVAAHIGRGWRVQGGWRLDGLEPAAARLTVGRVLGPVPGDAVANDDPVDDPVLIDAPVPVAPPEPEAEPSAWDDATVPVPPDTDDAVVWLPSPTCGWTPLDSDALSQVPGDQPVQVARPGYLPVTVPAREAASADLQPAPRQGSLVVLVHPGDTVRVASQPVGVSDGAAILNAPVGPFDAVVRGGGRRWEASGAVAEGYATWLRVPGAPDPHVFTFAVGSTAVRDSTLVRGLADDRGAWTYHIAGSYSPDGALEANLRLARLRAEAVRAALVAAGVPADALTVGDPEPPAAGLTAAEQRRVVVTPLPPRGDR